MVSGRARFAYFLLEALVVLQAIVVVGFVGFVAVDPDAGYLLPYLALTGYLLVLTGAVLIYFRREHAAVWREQLAGRPALPGERAWLRADRDAPRPPWYARLGVRALPEAFGLRGIALIFGGLLISTMTALVVLGLVP